MCVAVTLLPGAELSKEEVFQMGMANGDGAGVAWIKNGAVHWYKTVRYPVAEFHRIVNHHIGSPRLVHFRLATVGGTKPELCHPFEISAKAECEPVGSGKLVMIHNGHFGRWKEVMDLMEKEGLLPDRGPWSDTRLIAYLAHKDLDWLTVLGGRIALMDYEGQLTHLGDWQDYREGVKVSNKIWTNASVKEGGYSGFKKWQGWDESWDEKSWAAYQAQQNEKDQKRKEAIKEILARAEETVNGKEKQAEKTGGSGAGAQGAKSQRISQLPGRGVADRGRGGIGDGAGSPGQVGEGGGFRAGRKALPAGTGGNPGVSGGQLAAKEGGGGGAANSKGKKDPYQGNKGNAPRVVKYDPTPFCNPYTGRVYQSTESGTVVEITAKYTSAEREQMCIDAWDNPSPGLESHYAAVDGGEG